MERILLPGFPLLCPIKCDSFSAIFNFLLESSHPADPEEGGEKVEVYRTSSNPSRLREGDKPGLGRCAEEGQQEEEQEEGEKEVFGAW